MTNSRQWAIVVAYAFAADTPGNVGHLSALPYPGDNKSMRAGKGSLFVGFCCKLPRRGGSAVHPRVGWKQEKELLFLHEQRGNVIENKGPLWKKAEEAGMLLITKEISLDSRNVIENKGDDRYEKSYRAWRNILQS